MPCVEVFLLGHTKRRRDRRQDSFGQKWDVMQQADHDDDDDGTVSASTTACLRQCHV